MNQYEILAPAGTYETFKSVIQAGADAVYLGGDVFGARAFAGNLNQEEILTAIDYAHIHGKKLYLTVNTLLKNMELHRHLYDYLLPFYEAGLDAVIVQDFGVLQFVQEQFPGMEIHASTQMTVTDAFFARFLENNCKGLTRIVPARELTLEEIAFLHQNTSLELETFVHGALCYSYSGQCLMSSFMGGRSGNRGRCAQPCRLNYTKDGREKALLSLKDLSTIEILPEILEAGVYSLKIEGRMKSTEYAAGITSIYRTYLDEYLKNGAAGYHVSQEDLNRLLLLFDRGGVTKGYYVMHNGKEMIADEQKSDKSQSEKKAFEQKILAQYRDQEAKLKLNGHVTLLKNNPAILTLSSLSGDTFTVEGEMVSQAKNRPMSREDVLKQITKLGNTLYQMDHCTVDMDEDIFISNKGLNELRREGVEALMESMLKNHRRVSVLRKQFEIAKNDLPGEKKISVRVLNPIQGKAAIACSPHRLILECETMEVAEMAELCKKGNAAGIEVAFAMPRINRTSKDNFSKTILPELIAMKFQGCLIRSLGQMEQLRQLGFLGEFYSDYQVYGFNDLSCEFLHRMGITTITYPLELNEKESGHLKNPKGEFLVYGRIPLMVSAGCVDQNTNGCHGAGSNFSKLKDRKQAELPTLTCCRFCYNIIYNSVPLYLLDKVSCLPDTQFYGCSFTDESPEMVSQIIQNLKTSLSGRETDCKNQMPDAYTRGHFNRGVE